MTIGQMIKQTRLAAGMTQKELADKLGIASVGVSQWERGLRTPKIETIRRIADALGVDPYSLVDFDMELSMMEADSRNLEKAGDLLANAGISIEPTGTNDGTGPDGDEYSLWHTDADFPSEDSVTVTFRELIRVTRAVQADADARRQAYIRKRLDAELF